MNNRTLAWIFAAFIVGFGMPFVGCAGLTIAGGIALGQMGSGAAAGPATSTGFGPGIAVIPVTGAIVAGSAGPFEAGIAASDDIIAEIERADEDADARAILVVVNSPGGGVVASDEIYHALSNVEKPVVVYMSETAASGGYYISMAAEWIVANPNTLTGSIGVISQFPNAEELLDEWGIEFITIKSGPAKDTGSPFRDMTPEEEARWQALVDEVFANFVAVVAEGRNMSEADVRAVADGSVYTGQQALELGLVDAVGHQDDAVAKAAELAGLTGEPRLIYYPATPSFYELFGAATAGRSILPSPREFSNWLGWPSLMFEVR